MNETDNKNQFGGITKTSGKNRRYALPDGRKKYDTGILPIKRLRVRIPDELTTDPKARGGSWAGKWVTISLDRRVYDLGRELGYLNEEQDWLEKIVVQTYTARMKFGDRGHEYGIGSLSRSVTSHIAGFALNVVTWAIEHEEEEKRAEHNAKMKALEKEQEKERRKRLKAQRA